MAAALRDRGIPFKREYRFHQPPPGMQRRQWRFDFYIPQLRLAIEVQGGVFTRGRHVRGAALLKEYEKLNAAAAAGIRVLFAVRNGKEADISMIAMQVAAEWNDEA